MSKNNSNNRNNKNYNLKSDAVNRLVNADKMQISDDMKLKDPAKKYRSSFLDRIPATVKALFIKFWFAGAVCFFIFWGLNLLDALDQFVIMSIVLGLVSDILTDNILRFIETVPGENTKWMMFPHKKYWTMIANLLYACLLFLSVRILYVALNLLVKDFGLYIGVEPILFGIFYTGFDILFVSMKNLLISIVNDAKNKVNKQ